jgi:hypothetical protein
MRTTSDRWVRIPVACLLAAWMLSLPNTAAADSRQAYGQAMHLASENRLQQAIGTLDGAAAVLPASDPWAARIFAARTLLAMRRTQTALPELQTRANLEMDLARRFVSDHPLPAKRRVWPVVLLAAVFPGAGHAWLGRWHDALVSALLVWPMLLLTVWAAFRRMGPVTVFFALITVWLWSGTVFSALSLAERGNAETYMAWWQQLWQFSGLPGLPW